MVWRVLLTICIALAAYVAGMSIFWMSVEHIGPEAKVFVTGHWAAGLATGIEGAAAALNPGLLHEAMSILASLVREHPQLAPALTFALPAIAALFRILRPIVFWLTDGPPAFLGYRSLRSSRGLREHSVVSASPAEATERLMTFAESDAPDIPGRSFYGLFGPDPQLIERSARAWLKDLMKKGWHVGYLRREIPTDWSPRRKTAIVVDGSSEESLLRQLEALREMLLDKPAGPRVRVLCLTRADLPWPEEESSHGRLLRELEPVLFHAAGAGRERAARVRQDQRKADSPDETLEPGSVRAQPASAGGRFLRIASTHPDREAGALVEQAVSVFGADGDSLLLLAALWPPLPSHLRAELLPATGDKEKLKKTFGLPWERLNRTLPRLDEVARHVLVRCLDRLPAADRARLLNRFCARSPDAVIESFSRVFEELALGAVADRLRWRDEDDTRHLEASEDAMVTLRAAFEAFDHDGAMRRLFGPVYDALLVQAFEEMMSDARVIWLRRLRSWETQGDRKPETQRLIELLDALELRWPDTQSPSMSAQRSEPTRLDALRKGYLLGRAASGLLRQGRIRPLALIGRRLEAVTPGLLLQTSDAARRTDLLHRIAAQRPPMTMRDDLALIARCPAWVEQPAVLWRLMSVLFDWQVDRQVGEPLPGFENLLQPPLGAGAGAGAPSWLADGLEALDVLAILPLDDTGDERDWSQELALHNTLIIRLLASPDAVGRHIAVLIVHVAARAMDAMPPLGHPDPGANDHIIRIVSDPGMPSATWRRAAEVLAKLAAPPVADDMIYAWAVFADGGAEPPDLSSHPRLDFRGLEPCVAEARRRLVDPGADLPTRTAAGLVVLTFDDNAAAAASAVAEGALSASLHWSRRALLVIRLAQNGGPAALDALVQIALSPGPDAPDYAKLALYGIGAVERLTEHQHDLDPDGSFGLRTLLERAGAAMPD